MALRRQTLQIANGLWLTVAAGGGNGRRRGQAEQGHDSGRENCAHLAFPPCALSLERRRQEGDAIWRKRGRSKAEVRQTAALAAAFCSASQGVPSSSSGHRLIADCHLIRK